MSSRKMFASISTAATPSPARTSVKRDSARSSQDFSKACGVMPLNASSSLKPRNGRPCCVFFVVDWPGQFRQVLLPPAFGGGVVPRGGRFAARQRAQDLLHVLRPAEGVLFEAREDQRVELPGDGHLRAL